MKSGGIFIFWGLYLLLTAAAMGQSNIAIYHSENFSSAPFTGITNTVSSARSPTDTVTITLSGIAGGIVSGAGLGGTGAYTVSAASPAALTSQQQALVYTPTSYVGTNETFAITVTNADSNNTDIYVSYPGAAAAETPYPEPVGTFTPISYKGVNIIGGESQYPTTNAYNYVYPGNKEIDYFAGKGFGMIRMSVSARRLQPASYGPLDPANRTDEPPNGYVTYPAGSQTNLLEIKRVLDHAYAKNMYVMIEPHDYGYIYDTLTSTNRLIGRDAEATAQFADWWTRIATKFKNYPNAIFNLINEPHDQTAAEWKTGAVAAINAIAGVTTAQLVAIPGTYWTSAYHWTRDSGNDTAWGTYAPPTGLQIAFDMHQYLDSDHSGTHVPCVVGIGSSSLTNATTWAGSHGFKIILGEVGWSTDATCPPEATTFMSYITNNADVWLGWTYFNGGSSVFYGSYGYGVVPTGYPTGPFTDKPQMSILRANK
jgi:endoglucanase